MSSPALRLLEALPSSVGLCSCVLLLPTSSGAASSTRGTHERSRALGRPFKLLPAVVVDTVRRNVELRVEALVLLVLLACGQRPWGGSR